MSEHTLADWHEAIRHCLADQNVQAVGPLLILMALDGYGHEAEEARRAMIRASGDPA